MEKKELHTLWKGESGKYIHPYSDQQLEAAILKAARRSVRKLYSRKEFILYIPLIILLVQRMTASPWYEEMIWFHSFILLIVSLTLAATLWSSWKMNRPEADKPVKEWIEYRIRVLERSIARKQKYGWLVYLLMLLLLGWLNWIALNVWAKPLRDLVLIQAIMVPLVLIGAYLGNKRSLKRYNRICLDLKNLYRQISENEEN